MEHTIHAVGVVYAQDDRSRYVSNLPVRDMNVWIYRGDDHGVSLVVAGASLRVPLVGDWSVKIPKIFPSTGFADYTLFRRIHDFCQFWTDESRGIITGSAIA